MVTAIATPARVPVERRGPRVREIGRSTNPGFTLDCALVSSILRDGFRPEAHALGLFFSTSSRQAPSVSESPNHCRSHCPHEGRSLQFQGRPRP